MKEHLYQVEFYDAAGNWLYDKQISAYNMQDAAKYLNQYLAEARGNEASAEFWRAGAGRPKRPRLVEY